ncbi:hypothetical protein CYMTET_29935, partial [Cymbomonas tetramitiformis]
ESLAGHVAHTLDDTSLGGTSFDARVCDLGDGKCRFSETAVRNIQRKAVVDMVVAGMTDTAISLPGSSFIKEGALAWSVHHAPTNGMDWGFNFAGEVFLEQDGLLASTQQIESDLGAAHCNAVTKN